MRRLTLLVAGLALAATGCADAATGTSSSIAPTAAPTTTVAAFPQTIDQGGRTVEIAAPPERIAALSATHVEMLFAIGAGDRVIAGDLFTNHPEEATSLPKIDSFDLNVESVVELDPDLVILSFDPGGVVDALGAVGIATLLFPGATSLSDVYEQIRTLGRVTGMVDGADETVFDMQQNLLAAVDAAGTAGIGASVYHETDPISFYTPNSDTFIGELYSILGLVNIADAAADEFGSGFPQLSPEYIIDANPDFIFMAGFGEDPDSLAARPGWDTITAVQEGRVYLLDTDLASRWSPRIVDLLWSISGALGGAS